MGAIAVPIVPGQEEAWKAFANDLLNGRAEEFNNFNERFELTSHKSWYQETPDGAMVIAYHDGPGAGSFMEKLATSDHPFDSWFRERISTIHGMDATQPMPGGPPQLIVDV